LDESLPGHPPTNPIEEEPMPRGSIRPVIFPIGPSIAYIPITRGLFALIDSDNAHLGEVNWCAKPHHSSGVFYAERVMVLGIYRITIRLHDAVFGHSEKGFVDHRNRNSLDNRRANLRAATQKENSCNTMKTKKSSYMYGAHFDKFKKPGWKAWRSQIFVDGKIKFLGYFSTEIEAHNAYVQSSREYHGEFSAHG
jgi:hypothetical protein